MKVIASLAENFKLEDLDIALEEIKTFVSQSVEQGTAAHDVEVGIFSKVIKLGMQALGSFFSLTGTGDLGETLELSNGEQVRRLPEDHTRVLQTVFGAFTLTRTVYGSYEGRKIKFTPTDARLQLPESEFSFLMQDWSQFLAADHSFSKVVEVLKKILGIKVPVDSLERMNRSMAEDVNSFRESKPLPSPEKEAAILVVTADGKGVPVRKSSAKPQIMAHEKKEKMEPEDKKRMAIVGAVYTIDPNPRTPEQVVESLFSNPNERKESKEKDRPKPKNKHVFAKMPKANNPDFKPINDVFQTLKMQVEFSKKG